MRNKMLFVLLAALAAFPVFAQGPPITKQIAQQYDTPPFVQAPTVANFSAAPAALGNQTCYYWIVTQSTNPSATSVPLGLPLFICPTTAGGTAQNPVTLNWTLVPGATYDVLETTTSTMPTGTNTVAIATGLTVGNLTDTGQARSSYTLLPAGLNWQEFNNLIAGVPTLQWCYNGNCILNVTPSGVNVTPTTPPGGGTGTAGGACTATTAQPGTFCMGPIPTVNGQNPTFQTAFVNNGGTSLASPATITGQPLTANASIGILATSLGSGALTNAPDGTWTLLDNAAGTNDFSLYRKNFTSTTANNLSSTFTTSGNSSWQQYLFFLGGTFGSIPHTATSGTVTCPGLNDQCAAATIASVSANNTLFMTGNSNSATITTLNSATITDTTGDQWVKVGSTSADAGGPAPSNSFIYIDQYASAGSHTINIDSHQNAAIIGGCCKVYELAGTAPYFTGAAGPPSFRFPTTQDFAIAGIVTPGIAASKTVVLGGNVTVGNTDTTVLTLTLQAPQTGCPCRALISYSGWANFAGVTNEPDFDFWVSDGTNKMIPFTSGQSNASTGATTTVSASGLSTANATPVSYVNGANITFTLHGIVSSANAGTQQFSYQAAQPTGGSGASSFLQVTYLPSSF